jgi:hypothetical protein
MTYDRDLKIMARVIPVLMAGNAGGAITAALGHDWITCVAFVCWFINLCVWRQTNRNMQRTRDNVRLCDAAIMKVMAGDRLD